MHPSVFKCKGSIFIFFFIIILVADKINIYGSKKTAN